MDDNQIPDNDGGDSPNELPDGSLPRNVGEEHVNQPVQNNNPPQSTANDPEETPEKSAISRPWDSLKEAENTNRIMAICTIFIALATGVSSCEIVSSSHQTDDIIAAAKNIETALETANSQYLYGLQQTLGQSQKIADASAEQSGRVLDANIASSRLDQRAWLGTGDFSYAITETGPVGSTALVTNTGKTPALNILCRTTGTTKLENAAFGKSDIIYPPELPVIKQGTLFPNQRFPLIVGGPPLQASVQKTWFDNVQGGVWIQYFFGEVRYTDTFGKEHWTHFCTKFVPSTKSGTPCPIYNETDDTNPHHRIKPN